MNTVAEALREATARLAPTSDTARLDAELLMAHAMGKSRSDVLLRHQHDTPPRVFQALLARREQHEPVAYIVGTKEFYGREFVVAPGVLIPRMDSETTVIAALEAAPAPSRVLDCGVGSGALLFTVLAERPGAIGVGIDRSRKALDIADRNMWRLELHHRTGLALGDWTKPRWAKRLGLFDLIIANPPYVEADADLAPSVRDFEPAEALFAGADGLDAYRELVPQLPPLLEGGGIVVLEIGASQAEQVADIAAQSGFDSELRRDLGGRPRALVLRSALK